MKIVAEIHMKMTFKAQLRDIFPVKFIITG